MESSITNLVKDKIKSNEKMTEKKKKILEVSIELFSKNGFSNTSTSQIAKEAGVAEGTIFKHFKSKENLISENILPFMLEHIFPQVANEFVNERLEAEYEDFEFFIYSIVKDRIEFINENYKMVKIFFTEIMYREDFRMRLINSIPENLIKSFNKILDKFKENDIVVDWPNLDIARFIITNILGYVMAKFALSYKIDIQDDEEIKKISRFLTRGLTK